MDSTRRESLRLIGATALGAPLAGCVVGNDLAGDDGRNDSPDDRDDSPDDRDEGGGDVSVSEVTVRPEIVAPDSPDSYGTYGNRDEQFVGVRLDVDSPADHPPDSFAVTVDGEHHDVFERLGGWGGPGFGDPYDPGNDGEGTGWLAARLSNPLEGDEAGLVWDDREFAFDAAVLGRLNRPPASWQVAFQAPERVELDETATLEVTVENTAEVDGTFVAAFNRIGPRIAYAPEAKIHLDVAAGETGEWTYDYRPEDPEIAEVDDPTAEFRLGWRDDSATRSIDVETG